MGKKICDKCKTKLAVWSYLPKDYFYCDDCIISSDDKVGCSCNWKYINTDGKPDGIEGKDWIWVIYDGDDYLRPITRDDKIWVNIDDNGRPLPCVEYDYDVDGYEEPTFVEFMGNWIVNLYTTFKNFLKFILC